MPEPVTVRLYYVPQTFPCGPQSSCCGPVGQTEAELDEYTLRLRQALPGVAVDRIDVSQPLKLARDAPVIRLLNAFGHGACPIFAVNGEVVSMGPPAITELLELIRTRIAGAAAAS